ncbi:condensation domain-containing protein [Streptomyces sp. BK022]|uniref:condensation domain-containing protein n=1 Tax=Streptomyces sp. BK022 TaxID=2512123 RepID=UPI001029D083|nr:condensation domain-containing protein [Streptomyces sp. BK022]RZU45720.1 condensation domain-containing protein [Streptomyces sp. BK022]
MIFVAVQTHALTPAQLLWHNKLKTNPSLGDALWTSYRIEGELDVSAFVRALARAVSRCDALRIGVSRDTGSGKLCQWLRPEPTGQALVTCQNIRNGSEEKFARYARTAIAADIASGYDLATEYPFTFRLLRHSSRLHAFQATFSHLAVDATGQSLFLADLWRNLAYVMGDAETEPAPSASFLTAADAHAAELAERGDTTAGFWQERNRMVRAMAGPRDAISSNTYTQEGVTLFVEIDGPELVELRERCRRERYTEFQVAIAALAGAMFQVTTRELLGITIAVDARKAEEREVAGMFAIPLTLFLRRSDRRDVLLRGIREEVLALLRNRRVAGETLAGFRADLAATDINIDVAASYLKDLTFSQAVQVGQVLARPGAYDPVFTAAVGGSDLQVTSREDLLQMILRLGPSFSAPETSSTILKELRARL